MTAQIAEEFLYEGNWVRMCAEPLEDYFRIVGKHPRFFMPCTALWRGYVGTWEIIDDRLYMVRLQGLDGRQAILEEDGSAVTLETLFPGYPERVFANWYSGTLRIPQGKLLEYIHMGYGSTYERDVLLVLKKGVVVGKFVQSNGVSNNANAPEGYGVAAYYCYREQSNGEQSS
jgi:hypothetical protein